MIMSRFCRVILSSILLLTAAVAQGPGELSEIDRVTVIPKQRGEAILEPIKCDFNSNVYFQVSEQSQDNRLSPVIRVAGDGTGFVFPMPVLGTRQMGIIDFAPTKAGGLALLTVDIDTGKEFQIMIYDRKGNVLVSFPLPALIDPLQIAVSPSDKILITGLRSEPAIAGVDHEQTFTGIFDATGRLEREISLQDDFEVGGPQSRSNSAEFLHTISTSIALADSDGDFIIARLRSDGPIHIVTSAGVDRDNGFRPTVPQGAYLSSVRLDGTTLAALYVKKTPRNTQNEISDVYVSLWDIRTQKELGQYHHSNWRLGSAFACHKAGVFTFLTRSDDGSNELQLVRASISK